MFYRFITIVLLSIGLIAASAEANQVFLNSVFTLSAGQRVTIDGERLLIKFNSVHEDSRCPVNAACVWAGNGQVEFEVIDSDGQKKTVILNSEDEARMAVLKNHSAMKSWEHTGKPSVWTALLYKSAIFGRFGSKS